MITSRFRMRWSCKRTVFALCTLCAPTVMAAQNIAVPSGQPLTFLGFLAEQDAAVVRFRFLAPDIGAVFGFEDVVQDFQALCDAQVMPVLAANGLAPRQIVLSMSAADVPFGQPAPEVLQFFEVFRSENGACIWEEF